MTTGIELSKHQIILPAWIDPYQTNLNNKPVTEQFVRRNRRNYPREVVKITDPKFVNLYISYDAEAEGPSLGTAISSLSTLCYVSIYLRALFSGLNLEETSLNDEPVWLLEFYSLIPGVLQLSERLEVFIQDVIMTADFRIKDPYYLGLLDWLQFLFDSYIFQEPQRIRSEVVTDLDNIEYSNSTDLPLRSLRLCLEYADLSPQILETFWKKVIHVRAMSMFSEVPSDKRRIPSELVSVICKCSTIESFNENWFNPHSTLRNKWENDEQLYYSIRSLLLFYLVL